MVLEDDDKTGLYVTIPIYFCVLLGCAIWANIRNRQEVFAPSSRNGSDGEERRPSFSVSAGLASLGGTSSHPDPIRSASGIASSEDTMGSMITAIGMGGGGSASGSMGLIATGNTDFLSSHYLGGRSLGPILTTGTLFASFFSGYTVVGIPNEAYETGWMTFRWLAGGMSIMMGFFGTNLRLRKAALVRNHKTPIDFITDRYQCQILRYTVLILQIIPSMFYLMAQVVALKSTFNSIFDLPPDEAYPVLIIMAITLFFEWIGGLRCVAMTDCVQGSIMVLAYLCLPPIVLKQFGGWKDLNPATYPRPDFYQTPSRHAQLDFWQFSMTLFNFFAFPHMMQRTYAAKNLKSLKVAFVTMGIGLWFLMMGGIFIGTMAVQILANNNTNSEEVEVENPFTSLLGQVIDLGGFPKVIGLITITATLAAIMSTADSLLVAISQLITEEVVYPISPEASPLTMVWVGRAASFCAVVIASLMGISWDRGVSEVATINFQLSSQSVFIFIFGLFGGNEQYDCHPWSLAIASLSAFIYVFAIYFGYISNQDEEEYMNAGVSALAIQLVLIVLFEGIRRFIWVPWRDPTGRRRRRGRGTRRTQPQEQAQYRRQPTSAAEAAAGAESAQDLIFPHRPTWDIPKRSRFGEKPLTPDLLWRMMEGIHEPLANPWYAAFMFLAISRSTPWVIGGYPKQVEDIASTLVGGLPWWVVQMLISLLIPSIAIFITLYRMPNRFPKYIPRRHSNASFHHRRTSTTSGNGRNNNSPSPAAAGGGLAAAAAPATTTTTTTTTLETPDPDVMELTPEELGHRTAYDKRNDLVYKRRRQILEKLGLSTTEIDSIVASTQQQLQNFQPHL